MTNKKLIKALEEILARAMDHPEFNAFLFNRRNIRDLANVGGDTCEWTMVAIIASEALNQPHELAELNQMVAEGKIS